MEFLRYSEIKFEGLHKRCLQCPDDYHNHRCRGRTLNRHIILFCNLAIYFEEFQMKIQNLLY